LSYKLRAHADPNARVTGLFYYRVRRRFLIAFDFSFHCPRYRPIRLFVWTKGFEGLRYTARRTLIRSDAGSAVSRGIRSRRVPF